MDPATIAGLALAVVPLIISAVENYEITFQPFVTYRRYSKEIAHFATKLEAQKAIFNNQCQILLLSADTDGVQSGVILDNILKLPHHPSRKDEVLNNHLEKLLGASAQSCISTLRLIHQTLEKIIRETKGFQELSSRKVGERSRFRHFKSKLKISFSKTRLNDIINELRLYNEDLRVLSNQLTAVSLKRSSKRAPRPPLLDDLRTTQQASEKLYGLLAARWVCRSQVDHAANLSLNVKKPQHSDTPGMRFRLSMTCIPQNTPSSKDAAWISIESRPTAELTTGDGQRSTHAAHMLKLTETLKGLDLGVESSKSRPIQSITSAAERSSGAGSTAPKITPRVERLCSYFYSQLQQSTIAGTSVVYSETTTTFEHSVYKCDCPQGYINKTLSLDKILQADADQRRREAWISKYKLARQLTLAILRFQSTPWLTHTLNSKDIQFPESKSTPRDQGYSLEDPFIHIQLSQAASSRQLQVTNAGHLSRNELLFNLGIILLELGYDAPLRYLRSTEDIRDTDEYTQFFTARRLGRSAPRELDARYGRLAKKCLDCDFGVGDDLNSMELQAAIVMDVVNELDRCIKVDGHIDSILSI